MKNQKKPLSRLLTLLVAVITFSYPVIGLAQASQWSTDGLGWVYRKQGDNPAEKFFAIGTVGLPGYDFSSTNETEFNNQAANFNLIYHEDEHHLRSYYHSKVMLTGFGKFIWWARILNGTYIFQNDTIGPFTELDWPTHGSPRRVTYKEMKLIRENLNWFEAHMNDMASDAKAKLMPEITLSHPNNYDVVWFLVDEPDNGCIGLSYSWDPNTIFAYNKAVKQVYPNALTFIDFFGNIRSSLHFYDRKNPNPDPTASPVVMQNGDDDYSEHMKLYDGITDPPNSLTDQQYFDNVFNLAKNYRTTPDPSPNQVPDIFSVNSYGPQWTKPSLAGLTVKALRAATGIEKPIWMFIQGHTHGLTVDAATYHKTIRAQVYSSIVNGATGIIFYSIDREEDYSNPEYWEAIKQIAGELEVNQQILKAETEHVNTIGNVEFIIKNLPNCERRMIAVNKNALQTPFSYPGFGTYTLEPYEVRIINESASDANGGIKILGLFSNAAAVEDLKFVDKCADPVTNPDRAIVMARAQNEFDHSVLPHMAQGDFDGDGIQDIVMLYKQGDDQQKILILKSTGAGGFTDRWNRNENNTLDFNIPLSTEWFKKPKSVFDIDKVKFMTTGDFDHNGKDDVVLLYKESSANHRIIILLSNGTDFFNLKGSLPTNNNFLIDATWLTKPSTSFDINAVSFVTTGNFDNNYETSGIPNKRDDLVLFYKQSDTQHKILILNSTGSTFVDMWKRNEQNTANFNMPLSAYWVRQPRSVFNIDQVHFVASGRLDGEGKDELIFLYTDTRSGTPLSKIVALHSTGTSFVDRWNRTEATITMPNEADWLNRTPSEFELEAVTNIAVGNFDNINFDDLVIQYMESDTQHKTLILHTDAAGNDFQDRMGQTAPQINIPFDCGWLIGNPFAFNVSEVRWLFAGKFNPDNFADLYMVAAKPGNPSGREASSGLVRRERETETKRETKTAFPNPTTGIVNIPLGEPGIYHITVRSLDGQPVLLKKIEGGTHLDLDLSDLPNSLYIISVRRNNLAVNYKIAKLK